MNGNAFIVGNESSNKSVLVNIHFCFLDIMIMLCLINNCCSGTSCLENLLSQHFRKNSIFAHNVFFLSGEDKEDEVLFKTYYFTDLI